MRSSVVTPVKKVWLAKKEVKTYLGVSDEWIDKYLYANIHVYNVGRKIFFRQDEIDAYIEKNKVV